MLSEVYRVLKPGGKYFLISCGDPRSRMAYLKTDSLPWESITLHTIPRTNSRRSHEAYPLRKITEPILLQKDLTLGPLFNLEDPDLHFVYVCLKVGGPKIKPVPVEEPLPMLRCKW
ncbi:hypothetical protein KC19_4G255500 [Ceratodon purpureus]|uniref:Uncharacterized protein n=1 Tax=Ceratodon purpureus TaxID=3225 RepID=A0A8T0ICL1_CERPU|nr:hypothetical protein KC19_4G255500 [Ceratodon purpureus]